MVLSLNPELWDMIIDYLHDDHASLSACALTCQSMCAGSQFHLFSSLKIHARHVPALLRAFDSSPALALHCRRLHVSFAHSILPDHWRALAASLLNVQELQFFRMRWPEHPGETEACLTGGFPQTTTLSFERCRFLSTHALLQTARAWPRVHTLAVRSITPRVAGAAGPPVRLRGLAVAAAFRFLRARAFDLSGLQTLDVALSWPLAGAFLAEACGAAGPSLTALTVRLTRYVDDGAGAPTTDGVSVQRGVAEQLTRALARNTRLRTLAVAAGEISNWGTIVRLWTGALLRGVAPAALEELACDMHVSHDRARDFGEFDWGALRAAIVRAASGPSSAGLVLRIQLTSPGALKDDVVGAVRMYLDGMEPRVTLEISWTASSQIACSLRCSFL